MKYLTDKEIIKWNHRIKNSGYFVNAVYDKKSSYPNIQIYKNDFNIGCSHLVSDPDIFYSFSFSVSSNRINEFFKIYEKVKSGIFYTKLIVSNDITHNIKENVDLIGAEELNHKIQGKEYTRFTYNYKDKLTSIMLNVAYIEDTIEFFQKIWGYDENGNEHLLIKFPIGSIVSKINDKSVDLLVLDYVYEKNINCEYYIDYILSEMIISGPIIKYGDTIILPEKKICFSRDNRIDDILN